MVGGDTCVCQVVLDGKPYRVKDSAIYCNACDDVVRMCVCVHVVGLFMHVFCKFVCLAPCLNVCACVCMPGCGGKLSSVQARSRHRR